MFSETPLAWYWRRSSFLFEDENDRNSMIVMSFARSIVTNNQKIVKTAQAAEAM